MSAGRGEGGRVQVHSEIGRLRRVVVHRPGEEVLRMTQAEMERLLFDDILALEPAQREHDVLQEILSVHGAEVLRVGDLLRDALERAPAGAVEELLEQVCDLGGEPALAPVLAAWPPERLAAALIEGVRWAEVDGVPESLARMRARLWHQAHVPLRPVPNLLFMRDPCIPVFDHVVAARMATAARAREPLLGQFALTWGLQTEVPFLFDDDDRGRARVFRSLEGGDVLVISPRCLLIGASERTTPQTIERLAREALFPAFPELERVHVVFMPRHRSVMHLDTVLTQVDRDLFLGHVPMVEGRPGSSPLQVATLERGGPAVEAGGGILDVLREELGPQVELVPCGGDDPLHQDREQWTDGANAVCLAPGHVVLYSRNVRTLQVLRERFGFAAVAVDARDRVDERQAALRSSVDEPRVVYTFTGSELSRARGGARCMTMPLVRDPVDG